MQCRKTLRQKLKAFVDSTKILRRSKDNMNKKFLSLVLALVMVLGTLTPVFAEEAAAPKDKIEKAAKTAPSAKVQWLVDQKIVSGRKLFKDGDEKTDLSLDKNLQRDEITRLLVLGRGLENLANLVQGTMRPYVDVDNSNWANGVITVGSYHLKNTQGVPMLAGYPGNKFLPTRNVSYAELAKMLVCLVDNTITPKMVENFQWPSDWMVRAANLGILAGVEVKDSKAFVTRQAAFEMLYNALYLYDTRHEVDYGTKFGVVSGYANGELKLNQGDKAFTVKLSNNTVYVRNSGFVGYMPLAANQGQLQLGSLVRVIADKDGNATHIVEMGNPKDGAILEGNRWYGVADEVIKGFADFKTDLGKKNTMELTVDTANWLTLQQVEKFHKDGSLPTLDAAKNVTVKLTPNTKYFVADAIMNSLTEVDNATARKLVEKSAYGHELVNIPNVYVGYDKLAKGMVNRETTEARVVVFNVVLKSNQDYATVRVTQPSNGVYNFYAEDTMAKETQYSLAKYTGAMPGYDRPEGRFNTNTAGYNGHFEKYNVLDLDLNKDTKEVFGTGLVIEYATAPSFKVDRLYADHGQYILMDLRGTNGPVKGIRVDRHNTDIFTEGVFNERDLVGKYIQLSKKNYTGNFKDGFVINPVISGAISVLDNDHNFAPLKDGAFQNPLKVKATISKAPIKIDVNKYRVDVDEFVYDASLDAYQEQVLNDRNQRYFVTADEATALEAARNAGNGKVQVKAEVIVEQKVQGLIYLEIGLKPVVEMTQLKVVLPEEANKTKVKDLAKLTETEEKSIIANLKGLAGNANVKFEFVEKDGKRVIKASQDKMFDQFIEISDVATK